MKRSASHILVLGLIAMSGCAPKVADVTLQDVVSANREAAQSRDVSSRQPRAPKRSKYALLMEQFQRGTKPGQYAFEPGSVMGGRCVFVNRPNTTYQAFASVHLGKKLSSVVVTSLINDTSVSTAVAANDFTAFSKDDIADTYERHQLLVDEFTPVQREYPKELPFSEIIAPKFSDSVHFYLGGSDLAKLKDPNQSVIGFRAVQAEKSKSGKEGFVIEHYCAKPQGCAATATLRETHYLEAFAYCYYPDKFYPRR